MLLINLRDFYQDSRVSFISFVNKFFYVNYFTFRQSKIRTGREDERGGSHRTDFKVRSTLVGSREGIRPISGRVLPSGSRIE